MLHQTRYCEKCKTMLQSIILHHKYNEKESAALPKDFCPECKIIELSGDDIDFFIFGEENKGMT